MAVSPLSMTASARPWAGGAGGWGEVARWRCCKRPQRQRLPWLAFAGVPEHNVCRGVGRYTHLAPPYAAAGLNLEVPSTCCHPRPCPDPCPCTRTRAIKHGVGHVRHLCTRGQGAGGHALQHLGGGHAQLASNVGLGDQPAGEGGGRREGRAEAAAATLVARCVKQVRGLHGQCDGCRGLLVAVAVAGCMCSPGSCCELAEQAVL